MLTHQNFNELKQYTTAKLTKGNEWYISFYAYNPEEKKLTRKKIKLNHIKTNRLQYANELIKRINTNLSQGWNPFIEPEKEKSYHKLSEAVDKFLLLAERKLNDGVIRAETHKDYISYLRNLQKWLNEKKYGDIYIYKLDKKLIGEFLEYIYIDKGRTSTTRNNYLNMLRVFAGYLVEKDFLKSKFTDGLTPLKTAQKKRTVIEKIDLQRIKDYLIEENPFYLLACEVLYFTMIRPKEMSFLKVNVINFKESTIYVDRTFTKNRKDAIVTIPNTLGQLIMDLKIYEYPGDYYLFSDGFKPGKERKSEKQFRDFWLKMRKKLKLPDNYHFYSLKDSGITDMLETTNNTLLVRDQARHSSIAITDLYLRKSRMKANPEIKNLNMEFGK